jgi:transposase
VAQVNDLSRSLTAFDPISTLVVVVESKASWLVSGAVPGVERQPLKKLEPDALVQTRLAAGSFPVRGDRVQLQQVILNRC